jgi:toxin ParE1/3/4
MAAHRIRAAIVRTIENLTSLPGRGRNGVLPGTREIPVRGTPYVVVYEFDADAVMVLRIRHTSRDPHP